MKVCYVGAVASMLTTLVCGYSFSEIKSIAKENTGQTVDEENRIYGGSDATIGDYPYIASLRFGPVTLHYDVKVEYDDITFCGGTLIAPQWILTSATCSLYANESPVRVSLGSGLGSGSSEGEQIDVVEKFRHPNYTSQGAAFANDLALYKLATPSTQEPAKLSAANGSDVGVGTKAIVLGWGKTKDANASSQLQAAQVEIMSSDKCTTEVDYGNSVVLDNMLCAGGKNGQSPCTGDSGGPLVSNGVVVGIASLVDDEGCGTKPAIFMPLTGSFDYINEILNGGSSGNFTGDFGYTPPSQVAPAPTPTIPAETIPPDYEEDYDDDYDDDYDEN
ncbi:hypothetical protein PHYBOEH_007579 [Phytophthora boehmeriae]|uniref:Peptidase S1 domain-containing protein n=1 Tax=Phytophthora boehmeriae TaxID=109152 RepID=A0A8T1W596_9STRA|nr:hypothetical protein PHYBOEH_007579 [Phytophthora boehmeriae]